MTTEQNDELNGIITCDLTVEIAKGKLLDIEAKIAKLNNAINILKKHKRMLQDFCSQGSTSFKIHDIVEIKDRTGKEKTTYGVITMVTYNYKINDICYLIRKCSKDHSKCFKTILNLSKYSLPLSEGMSYDMLKTIDHERFETTVVGHYDNPIIIF